MAERSAASASRSYLAAALADPVNRIAAGVVGVALLSVGAVARAPLSQPFARELRDLTVYQARGELTLQGFELPCRGDCTSARPRVALVFHRPLPERFELELAGREVVPARDPAAAPAELRLGGERRPLAFASEPGTRRLELANPGGLRRLELVLPPGERIALSRVALRRLERP